MVRVFPDDAIEPAEGDGAAADGTIRQVSELSRSRRCSTRSPAGGARVEFVITCAATVSTMLPYLRTEEGLWVLNRFATQMAGDEEGLR
jgi:hypothetical protein